MTDTPDNPSLNCLVELANRDGVDIRPTLLRVMTDLYVQKPMHSADEDRHFTELALRLFDLVDAPTRTIVAEKIAGYTNAPMAVRRRALRDRVAPSDSLGGGRSPADPFAGDKALLDELNELFFAASAEERRLILANLPMDRSRRLRQSPSRLRVRQPSAWKRPRSDTMARASRANYSARSPSHRRWRAA